jgi:ribosomal-protein-alanine N-acetyltransferase
LTLRVQGGRATPRAWHNRRMSAVDIDLGFANASDAPRLARLSRDLIEAGLGWAYRAKRIADLIADAETVALVARDRGEPIGFAVMRFGDERAHLILLAVDAVHQRRGVARRMIEWLVESALVAGLASVHVELRAGNAPAFDFYRSLGFVETFRVPGYYRGRETAVRMLRMLRRSSEDGRASSRTSP